MDGNFSESAQTLSPAPNECTANESSNRGFSAPQHAPSIHQEANPRFVGLKEFSELTGISDSTIRRRVRDGSLPVVQMGGKGKKLLFPIDALTCVNAPIASTGDSDPVELILLSPSGTQADIPADSHPRWMQKLIRRPK